MVDALKKLDKKFLIIAGCIILIPIFVIVFLAIIQGCSGGTVTHKKYEEKMVSAAQKYFNDKNKLPKEEAELVTVELSELVESGYIKSAEKLLEDSTCNGEVSVRRNGSSVEVNGEGFLNYIVTLACDKYNTVHLVDKLKEDVVNAESGLYQVGEDYVFKGDKVNNYINIFDVSYRIMSIDKNNIIKLVKSEPEITSRVWDNKFNVEVNHSYGKNIYKDSVILTYLLNDYENAKKISKNTKKHIVAYDVCIGKRSSTDYSINKTIDCSETLEKQVVSLMNVSDFAMASADPDCKTTKDRVCKNYNYLSRIATSTWTLNTVSENTYEAFFISDGLAEHQNANSYNEYNIVIYIDGNELYTSGEGTTLNPYIIAE